ncbi:alpha-ketoglutarate-dependent dioxygenase AlkB [Corynebacterium sp. H127]
MPAYLSPNMQADLVEAARQVSRGMARPTLPSGQMSVYMQPLGYRWQGNLNSYEPSPLPMPQWARQLGRQGLLMASKSAPELSGWVRRFRPEMLLINYYPPGARMGMHQDAGEESEAPIVSISIGDSALFRLGNTENRNRPWCEIQLLSGDLLVFGGEHRRAFHGVPKVYDGTAPEGCGIREGRINFTIRQVNL